ncbi:MAG: hypothetical protein P8X97_07570 [Candidatus Bathyarchaeota archaeon]
MASSKLEYSRNQIITPWLAKELEREIPDLDIYGSERKLLDFAYKDLETFLEIETSEANFEDIEEFLNKGIHTDEIQSFIKIWTRQWLEKWRQRVTLCQQMPQISLSFLKIKNKATKLFKEMEKQEELKKLVIQKLINKGEVCMSELIAENLIVEEIAHRLKINKGRNPLDESILDPWSIFQELVPRVNRLAERRTPIIHLKLMMDL